MTDTHTHLYYNEECEAFIKRAIEAGIDRMIMPNVDTQSITPMKDLANKFPENFRMAMGLHPTSVGEDIDEQFSAIENELKSNSKDFIAIGEIGMDLYWDKTFLNKQQEIFHLQLSMAEKLQKPVIIHCREALNETLEVLSEHPASIGVFHSFGGSVEDVETILKQTDGRFYFGINGIVTFKNSNLRNVLLSIPKEQILLETDSPYLAPVPFRGKKNESAYLPYINAVVAESLGLTPNETATLTSNNSINLFGF